MNFNKTICGNKNIFFLVEFQILFFTFFIALASCGVVGPYGPHYAPEGPLHYGPYAPHAPVAYAPGNFTFYELY